MEARGEDSSPIDVVPARVAVLVEMIAAGAVLVRCTDRDLGRAVAFAARLRKRGARSETAS